MVEELARATDLPPAAVRAASRDTARAGAFLLAEEMTRAAPTREPPLAAEARQAVTAAEGAERELVVAER